ncbi:phospholipase D-like domain-containing protein [Clostridium estertheticum]|nr:phospholipase D-like domain-containing protein [Clostridium estertheticum]
MIKIVTFNSSAENSKLLNEVGKLKDTTEVEIITNIPNRYATYFSDVARKRARKNIISYTEQLNPENFQPMVSSYFNFSNHSKIILTENIAYIGSANASDESDKNFESGVIIKDKMIITEIIRDIIPMIKEDSIEYYGNGVSIYIILVLNLITRLKRIKEQFHFSFYNINDHRGADIEYYDSYNADISNIN